MTCLTRFIPRLKLEPITHRPPCWDTLSGNSAGQSYPVVPHTAGIPASSTTSTVSAAALPGTKMIDRKSTRLNSSHVAISYAVFCLKKKKQKTQTKNHEDAET